MPLLKIRLGASMILNNYIKQGKLLIFPKKKKAKDAISQYILSFFEDNKTYNEQQVNEIIKAIYDDYAIIRRYLVDEAYLKRTDDGSSYIKGELV